MTQTTVRHEVEVDTRLAAAYEASYDAGRKCRGAWGTLVHILPRDQREQFDDDVRFARSSYAPAKVLAAAHEHAATCGEWDRRDVERYLTEYYAKAQTLTDAIDAERLIAEEYEGWSRFFLVTSSKGHIHSSMNCSTCQWTTTYGWLPDVSGLDEEAAVDAHGALLCTFCFPSAPVEWTNHYEAEELRKQAESCPGSGQPGAEGGSRQGFCAGNYHTCTVCGQTVGGKGYNVRKHKAV
jgi:hypothetical protein